MRSQKAEDERKPKKHRLGADSKAGGAAAAVTAEPKAVLGGEWGGGRGGGQAQHGDAGLPWGYQQVSNVLCIVAFLVCLL